jgi:hypothetical protein
VTGDGGYADAAAQDRFCPPAEQCSILLIFDQSPRGNHIAAGAHRSAPPKVKFTGLTQNSQVDPAV